MWKMVLGDFIFTETISLGDFTNLYLILRSSLKIKLKSYIHSNSILADIFRDTERYNEGGQHSRSWLDFLSNYIESHLKRGLRN